MKKRAMVMAVAAMMAAGALTACGGGSKDTAGTADTKAAEETKAEEKSEETGAEASGEKQVFPAGTVTVYAMGNPQEPWWFTPWEIPSTDSSGLRPGWTTTETSLRMLRSSLYRPRVPLISVRRSQ